MKKSVILILIVSLLMVVVAGCGEAVAPTKPGTTKENTPNVEQETVV